MKPLRIAAVAFMTSIISLFWSYGSNAFVSPSGNPGVERPVVSADVFVYTFETFAFVLAAVGVTAMITAIPETRQWLSSYLAVIFMWITVVFFMFITLGRQTQAEIFRADREDLLLMGRLPGWEGFYSAGFLFFGTGVAFFGFVLQWCKITSRAFSIIGSILGIMLAVTAYARLVMGRDGVPDGFLAPSIFIMIWLFVLGVLIYRQPVHDFDIEQPTNPSSEPTG